MAQLHEALVFGAQAEAFFLIKLSFFWLNFTKRFGSTFEAQSHHEPFFVIGCGVLFEPNVKLQLQNGKWWQATN